ncbi:hypothetical protein KY363_06290 [Candidatus Woesearchaeota archaeon]|nr:hypothetical protein [Candidatus Woesearchaeota archaeon]
MVNILTVSPGDMHPVDFDRFDIAAAYNVEEGIAVASLELESRLGTLSHLRLEDNIERFIDFFGRNASEDALVYLIGGWSSSSPRVRSRSEEYVLALQERIVSSGHLIKAADIFYPSGRGCNVLLRHAQPVEVECYQKIMTPAGMKNFERGFHTIG